MTTWAKVAREGEFGFGTFGQGPFGGIRWTSVSKDSASWSAVSKQTSTWVEQVQSGTVAAMFELNEPLGGPEYTAVAKATTAWTPATKDS